MEDNEISWSDVTRRVVQYYVSCLVIALLIYFFVVKAETAGEKRGIAKGRAQYWDAFPKSHGKKIPVEQPAKEESNG